VPSLRVLRYLLRDSPLQSTLGVICLMQGFPTAMSILTSSSVMLNVRAPFYRETASNTYKSALFPLTSFIPEILWVAVMLLSVRFAILHFLDWFPYPTM
jgi:hypothetical protein